MRSPRFRRVTPPKQLLLTARDQEILRLVHRFRFLRSRHLTALIPGSKQNILRRLQRLFHSSFLDRPPAQLANVFRFGNQPMVYSLGRNASKYLNGGDGKWRSPYPWNEVRPLAPFLDHAVMTSDIMVAVELACRAQSLRLFDQPELAESLGVDQIAWQVSVKGSGGNSTQGVFPDRVFAFDFSNTPRLFLFLEVDRGTMPIERTSLKHTSIKRKLLAYQTLWRDSVPAKRHGISRFRVLTVTTNARRAQAIQTAVEQLDSAQGLFVTCSIENFLGHDVQSLLSLLAGTSGRQDDPIS